MLMRLGDTNLLYATLSSQILRTCYVPQSVFDKIERNSAI